MNDDKLTLYYYGDGLTEAERREVEAAIESDLDLARRYRVLCRDLDALKDPEPEAAPSHLHAQWHDLIDRAAAKEAAAASGPQRSFHLGSFFWGTAVAASLAAAFALGVYMSGDEADTIVPDNTTAGVIEMPGADPSLAFSRGLLVHFQESRDQLDTISPDSNGERSELIANIVQQNRLFARMAAQNDSGDLARVLRAFEPILVQLAADDLDPEDAMRLQAQLAFELNIVLTKLAHRVSDETDSLDI